MRKAIFALAMPHSASKVAQVVSLSLGVATHQGEHAGPAELIKAADAMLYRAKEHGRNRVESCC